MGPSYRLSELLFEPSSLVCVEGWLAGIDKEGGSGSTKHFADTSEEELIGYGCDW